MTNFSSEFGKSATPPTADVRTAFDQEPEDGKTETTAPGLHLYRGPLGFVRKASLWLGWSLRFRVPKQK